MKATPNRIPGRMWRLLISAALLSGCSAAGPQGPDRLADHPLAGLIWDTRAGQFVDYPTLRRAAADAGHVMLGEIHINPEHHRIQARIVGDLIAEGRSFALALEIFERDQQPEIDSAIEGAGATTGDVAAATAIEDTGWDWDGYEPLVRLALDNGLPVLAANAPGTEVMRVATEGLGSLPTEQRQALGLSAPLPAAAATALTEIIVASHCGHVLGDMAERLVEAQRLRDAAMADVLLGAQPGSTVLVTGAGHARRDYGAPLYLLDRDPAAEVLSIGLTEVQSDEVDPTAYLDRLEGLDVPFDFLWFTTRTVAEDPCEQFRESLKKLSLHGAQE